MKNKTTMKQLSPLQNIIFQLGGILMVAGAIMPMVPEVRMYAAAVFALGALFFGSMQLLQRYDGRNVTIRHLRRQQIFGAFMLMITAFLMIMKQYRTGLIPIRGDEWKVSLIVAAVLELYTAFRLPAELEKDNS